jgi:hypothetical protein
MNCENCGTEVTAPSWAFEGEMYDHLYHGPMNLNPVTMRCPKCKKYIDIPR